MTLDQLKMLVKIVETGSVISAAEALYRTQPTVSVAMKKLEEEFALKIFSRDQYRANLTPAGLALYERAKMVLRQSDSFEQLAHQLSTGQEPEIRIAIEGACPIPLFLQILKQCEERHPYTQFHLSVENLSGAVELLVQDKVDIAISPWPTEELQLDAIDFTHTTLIAVTSASNALAHIERKLHFEDLQEQVQIIVRDSSPVPSDKQFGVIPEIRRWYVNDHHTKKQIILSGMGWGRLPEHLIQAELRDGRLVRLEIENYPSPARLEIKVLRKHDHPMGPVTSDLWNMFQDLSKIGSVPLISE
ncbi:MAG: LysR family transcriptional regulator [SAR324 cluster bacterium]|nr:LysR family transcriptional regulator [SAR324 cluster bacterium]